MKPWFGGVWLGLVTALPAVAAEEWRVGSFQDAFLAAPFHQIIGEAYARVGLTPRFESLPLMRAEALLRAGELDADLARSDVAVTQMPQALRVNVALRSVEYLGLSRPPCPARLEPEQLARMRITMQRGNLALEAALPPGARVIAADAREALRYVMGGMADLAAIPMTPAMRTAAEREGVCAVTEPLVVVQLFHVVHTRHARWIPRLESAFRELEKSGFIARVWREAEKDYQTWQLRPTRPASGARP